MDPTSLGHDKRTNFATRISAELRDAIEQEAETRGASLSRVAEDWLERGRRDQRYADRISALSFSLGAVSGGLILAADLLEAHHPEQAHRMRNLVQKHMIPEPEA